MLITPQKNITAELYGSLHQISKYIIPIFFGLLTDAPVFNDQNPAPAAPLGAKDFGGKIADAISRLLSRRLLHDASAFSVAKFHCITTYHNHVHNKRHTMECRLQYVLTA